jgi:DNA (cytosine-5)-methyltransferase 1
MGEPYQLLDLFSGIGGFSLGLERSGGFKTAAFCEIDPFCRRVLAKHWPEVPCYDDITKLSAARLRADGIAIDAVCGGFPCQPFSTASRGRRVAADLWPEMFRIIADIQPECVIAENVQEKAVAIAAEHLIGLGYSADYRRVSATDCGADHQRDRWWVTAHADTKGELCRAIDAEVAELPALCSGIWGPENYARAVRVLDGVSYRLDRVGALGNAVVPQIPEIIGRAIMEARA